MQQVTSKNMSASKSIWHCTILVGDLWASSQFTQTTGLFNMHAAEAQIQTGRKTEWEQGTEIDWLKSESGSVKDNLTTWNRSQVFRKTRNVRIEKCKREQMNLYTPFYPLLKTANNQWCTILCYTTVLLNCAIWMVRCWLIVSNWQERWSQAKSQVYNNFAIYICLY